MELPEKSIDIQKLGFSMLLSIFSSGIFADGFRAMGQRDSNRLLA